MLKLVAMDSRRNIIIFIAVLVLGAAAALYETQSASSKRHASLVDSASIGAPVAPPASIPAQPQPQAPTPSQAAASTLTATPPASLVPTTAARESQGDHVTPPPNASTDTTNTEDDLRASQARLDAIDSIAQDADRLFATPNLPDDFGMRSTNPQGLDQLDYQTPDGAITTWTGPDGVSAQEAQLNNGEVVDRWFSDDGKVEQVMHQYDRDNSYSVYYYPTGEIEATRIVRNGTEIFTRYDQDGRQTQRTQTPASR